MAPCLFVFVVSLKESDIATYYTNSSILGDQTQFPMFEAVSVLSDVALYSDWIPLCNVSNLIKIVGMYIDM